VARRSKRQKLYDDWNDRQHWQRQNSPAIRGAFPGVKAVRINLTFEDPDKLGDPQPKQFKFGPDQKAFFYIPCAFRECVRGGFDLDAAVRDAVRTQTASVRGEQDCQGWQDPERVDQHRCWLKARYEIEIEYGGTTTVTASTLAFAPA
jgi:hypothetical protein